MMATVNLFLDTRRAKADGSFPLKLSVSHERKMRYVSLDVSLQADEWNANDRVVNSKNGQYRILNRWIDDVLERAREAVLGLRLTRGEQKLCIDDYVRCVSRCVKGGDEKERHVETFAERLVKFADMKKESTRKLYLFTLSRMRDFCDKMDSLRFEDITREWLVKFDAYLATTSNSQNYRNILLRNIRAVFNNAIDDEVTTFYPFRRFKIRPVETEKRSLTVEQLRELFDYPVEEYALQYRDMFKLMFMLCGINSVDLFRMRNLTDGRAVYHRAKTGRLYSIKVEPEAMEIIERWRGRDFLVSPCDSYRDYRDYAHRMNLALGRIGEVKRVGRGGKKVIKRAFPGLTTYWARHTWATIAAELDVPDAVIALALGHSSEHSTTEIYIRRNRKKVDEANRRVLDWVLYGKR